MIGQVPVPRHSVGVVIGRSGEMIKKIQSDAGVRIQFKPGERLASVPFLSLVFYMIITVCVCCGGVDDGTGPDKVAHIMGPPDRCEHAAGIINELLQSIRVREEGGGVRRCTSFMCMFFLSLLTSWM